MCLRLSKRAQSISEYVVLLALVAAALAAMRVYVQRGFQGRLKDTSDFLVAEMNAALQLDQEHAYAQQYEPGYRATVKNITSRTYLKEEMHKGGRQQKDYLKDEKGKDRSGTEVTQVETIR